MFSSPPSVSQSNIESVVQSHLQPGDRLTSPSSFPYGPFYKASLAVIPLTACILLFVFATLRTAVMCHVDMK